MRATKRGRTPDPAALRTSDLANLKQLRAAALQAAQPVAPPTPAPLPKRKRMQRPASVSTPAVQAAATDTGKVENTALAPADISLFRHAMKSVTPIKSHQHVMTAALPAASISMLRERREHATGSTPALAVQVSDHYRAAHIDQDDRVFVRSPDAGDVIKGLRRGKWPVQASLDLHGATLDQARERLDRFLQSCLEHQLRCVRIVHGKGYGSRNSMPVLKDVVRRWLTQLAAVLAYVECPEPDGGAGAVQVLLSAPDKNNTAYN